MTCSTLRFQAALLATIALLVLCGGCVLPVHNGTSRVFVDSAHAVRGDFMHEVRTPMFLSGAAEPGAWTVTWNKPTEADLRPVRTVLALPFYEYDVWLGVPDRIDLLPPRKLSLDQPATLDYPARWTGCLFLPFPYGMFFMSFIGSFFNWPPDPMLLAFADGCWPLLLPPPPSGCGPSKFTLEGDRWEVLKRAEDLEGSVRLVFYDRSKTYGLDLRNSLNLSGKMEYLLIHYRKALAKAIDRSTEFDDDDRRMIYSQFLTVAHALADDPEVSESSQRGLRKAATFLEKKLQRLAPETAPDSPAGGEP